ncbi:MAG: hypothetical protein P1U34_09980 [Coxiellaceae bacterium]|nr:hypothetical protein [Coxiellaceae bacterium]
MSQDQQHRKMIVDENISIDVIPWREFLKQLWDDQYWIASSQAPRNNDDTGKYHE